jgi:small-conductance mechanosensitive channel
MSDQVALETEARISPLINEKRRLFNDLLTTKGESSMSFSFEKSLSLSCSHTLTQAQTPMHSHGTCLHGASQKVLSVALIKNF